MTLTLVRPDDPSDPLPRQIFDWVHEMKASGAFEPSTITAYESTYRLFLAFLDRHNHRAVNKDVVTAFLRGLTNRAGDGPASAATVGRYYSALSSLYNWLLSEERVAMNPCAHVRLPKVRNTNPRPIPLRPWMQVWNMPGMAIEDRVLLGLGYYIGLRRFEIVLVESDMFDPEARMIHNFHRKGGGFDSVPYGEMLDFIRFHLPEHAGPNLDRFEADLAYVATTRAGKRLMPHNDTPAHLVYRYGETKKDPGWVNREIIRLIKEAGLEPDAFHPHDLRHSCVTNLLQAGVELQLVGALVSHSDSRTTRRYTKSAGLLARQLDRDKRALGGSQRPAAYDPDWYKR